MRICFIVLFGLLASCMANNDPYEKPQATPQENAPKVYVREMSSLSLPPLPEYFDCLRESDGVVIAAHRGGYRARSFPENAFETLKHTRETVTHIMEVDVAQTRDGVLFLFHDDNLRRMTGEDLDVRDAVWNDVKDLTLKDSFGQNTQFTPPKLKPVLDWAVSNNVILELDIKRSAKYEDVISTVRAANAQGNSILIAYTDGQAAKLAELAPNMMMTADVNSPDDIRRLERRGVKPENLIAWTGIDAPNGKAWTRLRKEGVEPAFGTLGRAGSSLDSVYARDGDLTEFADLADAGIVLLATDMADRVSKALRDRLKTARTCMIRG